MFNLKFTIMKIMPQNLKKWMAPLGLICLLALTLASCVKSTGVTQSKPLAGLEVIDASPDAPQLNFFLGTTEINQTTLGLGDFTYYFSAYAGVNTAGFYQAGTSTAIAQSNITLAATTYYTLFLANVKATPDFIFLKDSVYNPGSGNTAIRFVDASPDAPAVDLVIKGGTKIVQNYTYKNASAFIQIPLNEFGVDTLQVVQTGTSTVLATVPPKVFAANADYTVWLYGLANTSIPAEGLNANIMENLYFN
jgi:Domain of unknown function (DUF4397)